MKQLIAAGLCSLLLLAAVGIGAAAVSLPFEETTEVTDPVNETIQVDVEFNSTQLGNLPNGNENVTVELFDPSDSSTGTQTLTGDVNNSLQTAEFNSLSSTGNYTINVSTQLSDPDKSTAVEQVYVGGKSGSGAIIGFDGSSSGSWILLGGAAVIGWIWYRESEYEI